MSDTQVLQRFAGLSKFLAAFVILALIVAAAIMLSSHDGKRYVTVDFKQANSLYKGSDVKVLGVPVGRVESMTPRGNVVRVRISYDGKYKLPNDVKAAIISPSIVGDRFVQLAPAYNGGAILANNAVLDIKRSAVPVELDQIYSSLNDLSVALGPDGANKNGSLSNFIDNNAKSLDGQGAQLHETIKNFSKLSQTLSNNKEALFGSLDEVETFVAMLKKNDSSVRAFNDSTAKVSTVLAGERDDLAATLKSLSLALIDVHSLLKDNRAALRGNVDNLTLISNVLVNNQKSLEETIKAAPTALSNVAFTYNAKYGTLDTRGNLLETVTGGLKDPRLLLCSLLGEAGNAGDVCNTLGGYLASLPLGGLTSQLPRTAAGSGSTPKSELVNNSLQEMLAVN